MITDDGFDVTLVESKLPFLKDSYELRVKKVIKYVETQVVPKELLDTPDFLEDLIRMVKQRINDKVNCGN